MFKCKQNEDDNDIFAKLENDVSNNHLDNYLNSYMDEKIGSTKNFSANNSLNYNNIIDYPSVQKQKIEDMPSKGGSLDYKSKNIDFFSEGYTMCDPNEEFKCEFDKDDKHKTKNDDNCDIGY